MSTPRTDEEAVEMITGDGPVKTKTKWVHHTVSRQLERELAAAKADLDREIQAKHRVAMETRNPLLAKLEALSAELAAANARIRRLEEALGLTSSQCGDLHHPKRFQHKLGEPCPVEEIVRKAKETRP